MKCITYCFAERSPEGIHCLSNNFNCLDLSAFLLCLDLWFPMFRFWCYRRKVLLEMYILHTQNFIYMSTLQILFLNPLGRSTLPVNYVPESIHQPNCLTWYYIKQCLTIIRFIYFCIIKTALAHIPFRVF